MVTKYVSEPNWRRNYLFEVGRGQHEKSGDNIILRDLIMNNEVPFEIDENDSKLLNVNFGDDLGLTKDFIVAGYHPRFPKKLYGFNDLIPYLVIAGNEAFDCEKGIKYQSLAKNNNRETIVDGLAYAFRLTSGLSPNQINKKRIVINKGLDAILELKTQLAEVSLIDLEFPNLSLGTWNGRLGENLENSIIGGRYQKGNKLDLHFALIETLKGKVLYRF